MSTNPAKSGIQRAADGTSYIPASKRADGSTRKEIRVRPGYRPPEDVETYKNRSAEAWKNRGGGGVPGVETPEKVNDVDEAKSKNAKRREAARKKKEAEGEALAPGDGDLSAVLEQTTFSKPLEADESGKEQGNLPVVADSGIEAEAERQKKIRNHLKKLRAVRELKAKKVSGEKLSHDQIMKIGKEDELLRDLKKLNYNGPELSPEFETTEIADDKLS